MQLKKQEALKVLDKLKFSTRKGKENFAQFWHDGILVLTTSVPQGKGDMRVMNQFRQQLKLNENQLEEAKRCPFGYTEYIAHLKERKLI